MKKTTPLERRCAIWNATYPVGTLVKYYPLLGDDSHTLRTTRSTASVLSGHTAVVWLDGVAGCVSLDACVPVNLKPSPAVNISRSHKMSDTPKRYPADCGRAKHG